MKYCFISSDYPPLQGGVARYSDTLARGLQAIGQKVCVLVVTPEDDLQRVAFNSGYEDWVTRVTIAPKAALTGRLDNVKEALRLWSGCRSVVRRAFSSLGLVDSSFSLVDRVRSHIDSMVPDAIVFTDFCLQFVPLMAQLKRDKIPYGIVAHGHEFYRPGYPRSIRMSISGAIQKARWIFANSNYTSSLVHTWNYSPESIHIIPPAVPDSIIELGEKRNSRGRRNNHPVVLVSIARLIKRKGIDIVLRALKELVDAGEHVSYVVAGDGPERESLIALAESLGVSEAVIFLREVSENKKWDILSSADVFVQPSRNDCRSDVEGFGIVYLEAAAFSVPSVGSRVGGVVDAIDDGRTGLLVPPDSHRELADALHKMIVDTFLRQSYGESARLRLKSEFGAKAVASRLNQIIERTLRGK